MYRVDDPVLARLLERFVHQVHWISVLPNNIKVRYTIRIYIIQYCIYFILLFLNKLQNAVQGVLYVQNPVYIRVFEG